MQYKIIFFLLFFLSSCTETSIKKDFNDNINKLNDFFHSKDKNSRSDQGNNQFLIYSGDRVPEAKCQRATIKANGVSLKEFVVMLSGLYETNINYASNINYLNISPEAKKKAISAQSQSKSKSKVKKIEAPKIHLNMSDVCIGDVFNSLVENYDIGIEKLEYGYNLYPRQLKTKTFSVNYHNFYRKGKSSISIANSNLKEEEEKDNYSSITSESNETFWQSITHTIGSILRIKTAEEAEDSADEKEKAESFYVYKENGLIVVTAYPRQLRYIEEFLMKVNQNSVSQVLIEAKVLEIELRDEFNTGIQWDLLKQNLRYSSFASLSTDILGNDIVHGALNLATQEDLTSSALSGRVKNGRGFNAVMQALAAQGKISVISSPRILALNNQRALIKSGEDRYFVTNVTNLSLDTNNSNVTSQSGFDLEPFFSGVALDTTPRILSSSEVLLHIHPMISRVDDENKSITIDNKDTKIPVAMIQSREADAVVKAFSGDIIILGGMSQNYVRLDKSGLPIKSKGFVDKLTNLFSAKKQLSKKIELIILIKPTIINNFDQFEELGTYKILQ